MGFRLSLGCSITLLVNRYARLNNQEQGGEDEESGDESDDESEEESGEAGNAVYEAFNGLQLLVSARAATGYMGVVHAPKHGHRPFIVR